MWDHTTGGHGEALRPSAVGVAGTWRQRISGHVARLAGHPRGLARCTGLVPTRFRSHVSLKLPSLVSHWPLIASSSDPPATLAYTHPNIPCNPFYRLS